MHGAGLTINNDNDYVMGQFKNLNNQQTSFIQTLNEVAIHKLATLSPSLSIVCLHINTGLLPRAWTACC